MNERQFDSNQIQTFNIFVFVRHSHEFFFFCFVPKIFLLAVLKRTDNTYIINGNNLISDAGVYNAAGVEFDYRRIDDAIETSDENTEGVTEWITATGPIKEEIHLMVFIDTNLHRTLNIQQDLLTFFNHFIIPRYYDKIVIQALNMNICCR